MEYQIGQELFMIEIKRRRVKNIYLKLKAPHQVEIIANNRVSNQYLLDFLASKEQWLLKVNQKSKHKETKIFKINDSKMMIHDYQINVYYRQGKTHYEFNGNELVLYALNNHEKDYLKAYKQFSQAYVLAEINKIKHKYDQVVAKRGYPLVVDLKMTTIKTKWGYCNPAKNLIVINSMLIHYPKKCLEYVLWHEYTHLFVQNHSRDFYNLLSEFMPDYQSSRKLLK